MFSQFEMGLFSNNDSVSIIPAGRANILKVRSLARSRHDDIWKRSAFQFWINSQHEKIFFFLNLFFQPPYNQIVKIILIQKPKLIIIFPTGGDENWIWNI